MARSLLTTLSAGPEKEEGAENVEDEQLYAENAQDLVNKKLKLAYLEKQGKIFKQYSDKFTEKSFKEFTFHKGHKKSITCLEMNKDAKCFYTGSKDCCIIRWDTATGKKSVFKGEKHNRSIQGHFDEVNRDTRLLGFNDGSERG